MKRYCGWNRAPAQQRQQMDRDIPEKHVQQRAVLALDHRENSAGFPFEICHGRPDRFSEARARNRLGERLTISMRSTGQSPSRFCAMTTGRKDLNPAMCRWICNISGLRNVAQNSATDGGAGPIRARPLSARARVNPNSGGIHHSTLATINPVE